jgi:hypothetical protein
MEIETPKKEPERMLTAAENGLQQILAEVMSAQAAAPAAKRDVGMADEAAPTDYTQLETAVLRLRWLGEELSVRGGVALMRATLDTVIRQNVAGPWLRSIADTWWQGVGAWPVTPPKPKPPLPPLPY